MGEDENKDSSAGVEWRLGGELSSNDGQLLTGSGESYVGSGAKDSHHGYTFQFHLLMLYATRALNLGRKDFKMATEMAHAEKFDDVIFCYPKEGKEGGGRFFQFVHAKHSLNTRFFCPSQLFDRSEGPFSLIKYFASYRKMKRNGHLLGHGDEIRNLVICTNMGFKFGQPVGRFVFEEAILERSHWDEILSNDLWKFKDEFPGRREIVLFLKDSCVSLPRDFKESVMRGKRFLLRNPEGQGEMASLYDSYRKTLRREVLEPDMRLFRKDFVEGRGLSSAGSHFRDELWFGYLTHRSIDQPHNEEAFRSFLSASAVQVSGDLGDQPDTQRVSPKTLARSMSESLVKNKDTKKVKVDEEFPFLKDNFAALLDLVLIHKLDDVWVFDPGFLKGGWLPENLASFRESLRARVANAGFDFDVLEKYSFEVGRVEDVQNICCGDRIEQDVREFLGKLSFALNQPGIGEMERAVKKEVAKFLNVSDAGDAYGRFFGEIYGWAESRDARYLREEDVKRFFVERKREMTAGLRFNLRHPVVDFTGRDRQLCQVHEILQGRAESSQIPRSVVLSGLGGIGKTELAREYAKRHYSSQYEDVIWIDSENVERLESSFTMLAFGRLGILKKDGSGDVKSIEAVVQETYEFFRGKRTLVVFDNAEVRENVCKFLPRFFLGDEGVHVLMTSRSRDWRGFPVIDLDNFTPAEAHEFVRISLGQLPCWDEEEARELAAKLSNFPLALKQAVSYVEEMERTFRSEGKPYRIRDYSDLFCESSESLLRCPFRMELLNNYSETTYRTMKIALDHIRRSRCGKIAIPILNIMTYLSPDTIDTNVLRTAYPRYSTREVDKSLDLLRKFSVLRLDGSRAMMHRLIQTVNRINLKNSDKEEKAIEEAVALASVMDVEHVTSVWDHVLEHKSLVKTYSYMPHRISKQLWERSMSAVALDLLERSIKVFSDVLGPCHRDTLNSRRVMGKIYYYDVKYAEAAKIQRECWEDSKRVFGKDDPDTFKVHYHLGVSVMHFLGSMDEALRIFQEIVDRGTVLFGTEDEWVRNSKRQIIQILENSGREEGKVDQYRRDMIDWAERYIASNQGSETVHGESLNVTKKANRTERFNKVEEYVRLRTRKEGLVGQADLEELIQAKLVLAEKFEGEGNYDEACERYKSCLEELEGEYSENHGKVKMVRIKMSRVLVQMGNHAAALTLLEKCDATEGKVWDRYYAIIHVLYTFRALWGVGQREESIAFLVGKLKESKGEGRLSKLVVGLVLGKYSESFEEKRFDLMALILRQLYAALQGDVSLGPLLVEILGEAFSLTDQTYKSGHMKEGIELLKYIYQSFKLVLGDTDIKTLSIKFTFAMYYFGFGSRSTVTKGREYALEVHQSLCEQLGKGEDAAILTVMEGVLALLKVCIPKETFSDVLVTTQMKAIEHIAEDHPFHQKLNDIISDGVPTLPMS